MSGSTAPVSEREWRDTEETEEREQERRTASTGASERESEGVSE